jgi:hypothetical protein
MRRKDSTSATAVAGEQPRLTIRPAGPADADAIERLARLDSSRAPGGEVLLAEVAGEPWAALSLDDFHAVADPFRPTGELVFLLAERGRTTERHRSRGRRERRWRLRFAGGAA